MCRRRRCHCLRQMPFYFPSKQSVRTRSKFISFFFVLISSPFYFFSSFLFRNDVNVLRFESQIFFCISASRIRDTLHHRYITAHRVVAERLWCFVCVCVCVCMKSFSQSGIHCSLLCECLPPIADENEWSRVYDELEQVFCMFYVRGLIEWLLDENTRRKRSKRKENRIEFQVHNDCTQTHTQRVRRMEWSVQ